MKNRYKLLILVVLALFFVGCSISHHIKTPNYTNTDAAHITVYRKAVFKAGGLEMYLEIDNEVVCGLWERGSIEFTITPGQHYLMVSDGSGLSGQKATVVFESNKSYYISITAAFSHGGSFTVIEK